MKNLEFVHKYYRLIVWYRRSISALFAGLGTLIALNLIVPGPGSQTKVLVTTAPLSAGTTLKKSDFTEKSLADSSAWSTLHSEPDELIGRVLAHSLASNQPISTNDLVGTGLLLGLPKNFVAMSLPLSASTSTSLLSVGGLVDIYGASNDGFNTGKLVASRARILALPKSTGSSMFSNGSAISSIIVGVDSASAMSIAGNETNQGFTVALLP